MKDHLEIKGASTSFGSDISGLISDIESILTSGELTQGQWLKSFEDNFSKVCNTSHSIGVNSGGTALTIALRAMGIEGKEVIVPTNTFVATASAVIQAGGIPVFADTSFDSLSLSLKDIKEKFTPNTIAVIHVHMFGIITKELPKIVEWCKTKNIWLLEDAAHAHGAILNGKKAGSFGDAACFSFYATKIITTGGEGGIITTSNSILADKCRQLVNHGKSFSGSDYSIVSNNFRLPEISAAIGRSQIELLPQFLKHRRKIAEIYINGLKDSDGISIPEETKNLGNSFWRFPLLLKNKNLQLAFQNKMDIDFGVRINWMYAPLCHKQPLFKNLGYSKEQFPKSDEIITKLICLPNHMEVTFEGASKIVNAILKCNEELE